MDCSNGNEDNEVMVAEQFRKVFVGGLDAKTTDESLKSYFEKYGEIVDFVVVTNPNTKRTRGFGFVTFKDSKSVDEVQSSRPHKVDGRIVETKRAMPKEDDNKPESKVKVTKIFIGGLKDEVDEDQLRNHFSQFGNVTNVHVVTEKGSNKKRGFAFVEFDDYDPVDKAVLKKIHEIGTQQAEVKKALSKQQMDDLKRPKDRGMYGGGNYGGSGGWSNNQGYSNNGGGGSGYGNQRSYGGQNNGGWGMSGGGGGGGYNDEMNGNYNDFGSGYNNYNSGPMRGGNQFGSRNQGPYGGGRGGRGGNKGNRGGGGGGFRRF